jgi:hypothetical protein
MRLRSTTSVVALTAAVVVSMSVALPAAGAAKRSACQRLRGHDLAPAHSVKLVEHGNADDDTDLVGCVLPRGRVRTIASGADLDTVGAGYTIRQVAGRIVLVSSSFGNQYASTTDTRVWDLRGGHSYRIAATCVMTDGSECGPSQTIAPAAFVTPGGYAVAAVQGLTSPVTVEAFRRDGRARLVDAGTVDEIPTASLALQGNFATWTHAGQLRRADVR